MNDNLPCVRIAVDGTETPLPDEDLTTLQRAVGGYIELLGLPGGNQMFVDEDGRSKGLPPNPAASGLCGFSVVGDVVVIRRHLMN